MRKVIWEGDSLDVLRHFPTAVKENLGKDLLRVQAGQPPLDSKTLASATAAGVVELRDRDAKGQYRLVYYNKFAGKTYVLHVFQKKSQKTSR